MQEILKHVVPHVLSHVVHEYGEHRSHRELENSDNDLTQRIQVAASANLFAARALTRERLTRFDDAFADAQRALQLDGRSSLALLVRARLHARRASYPECIVDFRELQTHEDLPEHLFNEAQFFIGRAYEKLGNINAAWGSFLDLLKRGVHTKPEKAPWSLSTFSSKLIDIITDASIKDASLGAFIDEPLRAKNLAAGYSRSSDKLAGVRLLMDSIVLASKCSLVNNDDTRKELAKLALKASGMPKEEQWSFRIA